MHNRPIYKAVPLILIGIILGLAVTWSSTVKAQSDEVDGLDIVFVLDQSISNSSDLEGLRFYGVQHAIEWLARDHLNLHPSKEYNMAVINFGTESDAWRFDVDNWLQVFPQNFIEWSAQLESISESVERMRTTHNANQGETNIADALQLSRDLLAGRDNNHRQAVVLLSDLQAYSSDEAFGVSMAAIEAVVGEWETQNLYVLGVGAISNWETLQSEWEIIAQDPCRQSVGECDDLSQDRVSSVSTNDQLVRRIEEILRDLTSSFEDEENAEIVRQFLVSTAGNFIVPDNTYYLNLSYVDALPGSNEGIPRELTVTNPNGITDRSVRDENPIISFDIPDPVPGVYQFEIVPPDADGSLLLEFYIDPSESCNNTIYYEIANIFAMNDDFEGAFGYMMQAITECPDVEIALATLDDILASLPAGQSRTTVCSESIYDQIGQVFESQLNFDVAIDYYLRQIEECPATATTVNISRALVLASSIAGSQEGCQLSVYGQIAGIYDRAGRTSEAIDYYTQAIITCPNDNQSLVRLDELVETDAIQSGEALSQTLNLQLQVGQAYLDEGRYDDAIVHYQTALEIDPSNAIAQEKLNEAIEKSNNEFTLIFDWILRASPIIGAVLAVIVAVALGVWILKFVYVRLQRLSKTGEFAILPFVDATGEDALHGKEESLRILMTEWLASVGSIYDQSVSVRKLDNELPDLGVRHLSLFLWLATVNRAPSITLVDATLVGKHQDIFEGEYQPVIGLVVRQRGLEGKKVEKIRKFLKPMSEHISPTLEHYVDLTLEAAAWIDRRSIDMDPKVAQRLREASDLLTQIKAHIDDSQVDMAKQDLQKYRQSIEELKGAVNDRNLLKQIEQRAKEYQTLIQAKEKEQMQAEEQSKAQQNPDQQQENGPEESEGPSEVGVNPAAGSENEVADTISEDIAGTESAEQTSNDESLKEAETTETTGDDQADEFSGQTEDSEAETTNHISEDAVDAQDTMTDGQNEASLSQLGEDEATLPTSENDPGSQNETPSSHQDDDSQTDQDSSLIEGDDAPVSASKNPKPDSKKKDDTNGSSSVT